LHRPLLTDPPYSDRTHKGHDAVSGTSERGKTFVKPPAILAELPPAPQFEAVGRRIKVESGQVTIPSS